MTLVRTFFARCLSPMFRVGHDLVFFRFTLSHTGYGYIVLTRFALNPVVRVGQVDTGAERKKEQERESNFRRFHAIILPDRVPPDAGDGVTVTP